MANLITLDEYKSFENITSTKEDIRLELLINSVSQLVKTYCGNGIIDYATSAKTEEFSIQWNTNVVQLTESPLIDVSDVQIKETPTANFRILPTSEYYVDFNTDSVYRKNGNWPHGFGSVQVNYTAGYTSTPADLKLAVVDLVKYYFKDEHTQRRTLSGATVENQGTGEGKGFPDHIKRVLDLYKTY